MDGEVQGTVLEMEVGAQIDTGRQRREQQDFIRYVQFPAAHPIAQSKGNLFVLCDGVGGYPGGGVASQVAVETVIAEYYSDQERDIEGSLRKAIEAADKRVRAEGERLGQKSMATTIVCAVIRGQEMVVAHAGDSRAYRFRDNELSQLTADHLEPGSDHLLTRFLGGKSVDQAEKAKVDIRKEMLKDGDCILLSSDGLYDRVSEQTIQELIGSRYSSQVICANLIKAANEGNGKDNISALHIRLKTGPNAGRGVEMAVWYAPPIFNELIQHQYVPAYSSPLQTTTSWVAALPLLVLFIFGMAFVAVSSAWQLRDYKSDQADALRNLETVLDDYEDGEYGPKDEKFTNELDEAYRRLLRAGGTESSPLDILPLSTIPPNALQGLNPTPIPANEENNP